MEPRSFRLPAYRLTARPHRLSLAPSPITPLSTPPSPPTCLVNSSGRDVTLVAEPTGAEGRVGVRAEYLSLCAGPA